MYRLESISIGVVAFIGLLACSSGYCRWFVQKRETFPNELLSHRYVVLALDGNACVRCAYVRLTMAGLDRSCGLYCRTLDVVVLEFLHSFSHLCCCVVSYPCGFRYRTNCPFWLVRSCACTVGGWLAPSLSWLIEPLHFLMRTWAKISLACWFPVG